MMSKQKLHSQQTNLPLQAELSNDEIKSALICHINSRWYVGELFCHSSWVTCFERAGIKISLCTNKDYLEIFKEHPNIDVLYADDALTDAMLSRYDLVVFATTHPPQGYNNVVRRAIYSYNEGIAYVEFGKPLKIMTKFGFNLFTLATHQHGQTALPDGAYYRMQLNSQETAVAADLLDALFPGQPTTSIIILNPTASNSYTRQSDRNKAVDNSLEIKDYAMLIASLLKEFPDHQVLIGASVKGGDHANFQHMEVLAAHFSNEPRVRSILSAASMEKGISFRNFAALLSDHRVKQMIGNSTGSNAHLAATLDFPAMSIERAADTAMQQNWLHPKRGQMGSFRWRNPHRKTAAFNLSWENRSRSDFTHIAQALRFHGYAVCSEWNRLFGHKEDAAQFLARETFKIFDLVSCSDADVVACLPQIRTLSTMFVEDAMAEFYFNFADEATYLLIINQPTAASIFSYLHGLRPPANGSTSAIEALPLLSNTDRILFGHLIRDSNLYKLLKSLAEAKKVKGVAK